MNERTTRTPIRPKWTNSTTITSAPATRPAQSKSATDERNERQARRREVVLEQLRINMEREKHEALTTQRDAMNRSFRVQLGKLVKEKEELAKKLHALQTKPVTAAPPFNADFSELQRLNHENAHLKTEKKKIEEQFQSWKDSEQNRFANMRSLLDDKSCQLAEHKKQSRQQMIRIREETKSKDRVISHLETELRIQTGRAQQFRDLLEQNLLTSTNKHLILPASNDYDALIIREKRLELQLEDLREVLRQQQQEFADDKRELLRRHNEIERQQRPLRQKIKQYLTRNVELTNKNKELEEALAKMQELHTPSNLKRSLTRPNINLLGTTCQDEKQSRAEYVQQVQKLRKEQRYYSMWDLPPLLEVETDSAADVSSDGSDCSLSPVATSSGVASCSDSWNEDSRRELQVLFSQMAREHSELQRSYQMLYDKLRQLTTFSDGDGDNVNYATLQVDYNAAKARIRDLEEILQLKNNHIKRNAVPSLLEIQAKFVREKHSLETQLSIVSHQLQEAKKKSTGLQAELNESRDQNELLEFRILELEECQERVSSRCSTPRDRKDVCTDTDSDDLSVGDSGITSLTSFPVTECPSPPSSIHADPIQDCYLNDKISTVKSQLEGVVCALADPSQKAILTQLQALLGVCQTRLSIASKLSPNVKSDGSTPWDWQESGIFDDEHSSADTSTQTDDLEKEEPAPEHLIQSGESTQCCADVSCLPTESQNPDCDLEPPPETKHTIAQCTTAIAVAAEDDSHHDFVNVTTVVVVEDQLAPVMRQSETQTLKMDVDAASQTENDVMPTSEFRAAEEYYGGQIELLQKEKAALRRTVQSDRDESSLLAEQLQEMTKQVEFLQEREAEFDAILRKHRQMYDHEIDLARNSANGEVSMLKECLQLVWHEIKDTASTDEDVVGSHESVTEFTQHLINSVQMVCSELAQLRTKLVDLAEMEKAFQTTLQQADGLVHHIEERHLERIRLLELSEAEARNQLQQLQKQLLNTSIGSVDSEYTENLESKIKDLENENRALNAQVAKYQEIEEYCQHLRNRLEECDLMEQTFKQSVTDAERRFSVREHRYREQVDLLREELEKSRTNENEWQNRIEQKEKQVNVLRTQLEDEQKVITNMESDMKELHSKLARDDTCFRSEVTKLRSQLNISMAQLNDLESLNCQLREQIAQYQTQVASIQRNLQEENERCQELVALNSRLLQVQADMQSHADNAIGGKPLTEELFEAELDLCSTTLDDFTEISIPNTPTVIEGCTDVFEEHFKVLESLENYLESQNRLVEDSHESSTSTSATRESEQVALLEEQLAHLRAENHHLQETVSKGRCSADVMELLINQLKTNVPRDSLMDMLASMRKLAGWNLAAPLRDIQLLCTLLESSMNSTQPTTNIPPLNFVLDAKVVQKTKTILPEEDPFLSPASDLRVTRRVGQDGLVVAWLPSPDEDCAGYLICVNGEEAQRVRSAQRTKAVLCGLDLQKELEICIYSLSSDGFISAPDRDYYYPQESLTQNEATEAKVEAARSAPSEVETVNDNGALLEDVSPREVVVQTFYTNSSVTVRSSRRVSNVMGSRIPVRSCVP